MEKQIKELIRQCKILLYVYKVDKNINLEYIKKYKAILDYAFDEIINNKRT